MFVCFAAEDRYTIVEPLVHHIKNYGIEPWYDRHTMVMGDSRQEKNLDEGAGKCGYAVAVLSKHTGDSACAMEELSIVESRYNRDEVTVFPVLYEIEPNEIPPRAQWLKGLIFKEVDRHSGTRVICNHIACKITGDIVSTCCHQSITDILNNNLHPLPPAADALLRSYQEVDCANLNSRVTLLYAIYMILTLSRLIQADSRTFMVSKIFERLFAETRLNLDVDYRELWLLENSICILVDSYVADCTESKI